MSNEIDKFHKFKDDFVKLFEKGFLFPEDNSKYNFHISGKIINIFDKEFTAQFIITNLSDDPYTIEKFNLYYTTENQIEKLKSEITTNSFSIVYLRKNEAYLFVEKFLKEEQRDRIKSAIIEIKISGHKIIQFEKT